MVRSVLQRLRHGLGHRLALGGRGERVAARCLKRAGYRILRTNLRNRFGEVDLLVEAPDRRTIVLVEVKTASVQQTGPKDGVADHRWLPEIHVNRRKQRQLTALAGQLARRFGLTDRPIRFDVVGVDLPKEAAPVVRHHIGAFESHV